MNNTTSIVSILQNQVDTVREERDRLHTELQKSIFREEELETVLKEALEVVKGSIELTKINTPLDTLVTLQRIKRVLKN